LCPRCGLLGGGRRFRVRGLLPVRRCLGILLPRLRLCVLDRIAMHDCLVYRAFVADFRGNRDLRHDRLRKCGQRCNVSAQ